MFYKNDLFTIYVNNHNYTKLGDKNVNFHVNYEIVTWGNCVTKIDRNILKLSPFWRVQNLFRKWLVDFSLRNDSINDQTDQCIIKGDMNYNIFQTGLLKSTLRIHWSVTQMISKNKEILALNWIVNQTL